MKKKSDGKFTESKYSKKLKKRLKKANKDGGFYTNPEGKAVPLPSVL